MALLNKDHIREAFLRHLNAARKKWKFEVWAFVIMPNHVHILIHPLQKKYSIAAIRRDIKRPFARETLSRIRKEAPGTLKLLFAGTGKANRNIVSSKLQAGTIGISLHRRRFMQASNTSTRIPFARGFANRPSIGLGRARDGMPTSIASLRWTDALQWARGERQSLEDKLAGTGRDRNRSVAYPWHPTLTLSQATRPGSPRSWWSQCGDGW
ncbi:MAG: transposase [Armatimonadetes bacterium]|nr:transposase [Armatimonadota bacterium]